jgi:hypothetical protein
MGGGVYGVSDRCQSADASIALMIADIAIGSNIRHRYFGLTLEEWHLTGLDGNVNGAVVGLSYRFTTSDLWRVRNLETEPIRMSRQICRCCAEVVISKHITLALQLVKIPPN